MTKFAPKALPHQDEPDYLFKWKPGSQMSVDANVAGNEIERVKRKHKNLFKPEVLADESTPETAPLHPEFEWDDAVAAYGFRRNQAKEILRNIIYVDRKKPDDEPIRRYVSVVARKPEDEKPSHYYTDIVYAMSDEELRRQVISAALQAMQQFEAKYAQYEEFAEVIGVMRLTRQRFRQSDNDPDGRPRIF